MHVQEYRSVWTWINLSSAEISIRHEQMAKGPCGFGLFLLVPSDAKEVHGPVQIGLEVGFLHAREPEQASLEPSAQVIHELHDLQVRRVGDVLVGALDRLDEGRMGALHVVHDDGAR